MSMSEDERDPVDDAALSPETFAVDPPTLTAIVGRRAPDGTIIELEVAYAEIDGKAIHEGDIMIGDAMEVADREKFRKSPYLGHVIARAGGTWPNGVLPYLADESSARVVGKVAAHLAAKTNVRLQPRSTEESFVRFVTDSSNHSKVGRQGGEQIVSLTAGCTMGTALHETCHALGLWHEQCRKDRDEHIEIVAANVLPGCMPQFAVQKTDAACVGPYDYRSIMHYGPSEFSSPSGAITIRTKGGGSIGQRDGLSPGDIATLSSLYP
jgi:hypothetical protein